MGIELNEMSELKKKKKIKENLKKNKFVIHIVDNRNEDIDYFDLFDYIVQIDLFD